MSDYYVKTHDGGQVQGPFTAAGLKRLAQAGGLKAAFLVSRDRDRWIPAAHVHGLLLESARPVAEPAAAVAVTTRSPDPPDPPDAGELLPHRGFRLMALAAAGIACLGPLSILAWVNGRSDLKQMQAGLMDPAGELTTRIGMIFGIVASAFWTIVVLTVLVNS